MASVYRAHDTRLERDVAVKIIHSHLAEQPDFVERFIREARSAAKLSSPHVVSVYDQGVAPTPLGNLPYLVMQLIPGPDLRSQLSKHGSLPIGIALTITRQVLQALAVAHSADVIHRDVKPENILLDRELDISAIIEKPIINAQVADFGLARAASSSTQTAVVLGTVAYVAPELVTNAVAGPAADIYAVGVMLYELIAGSLPYTGETPVAIAYQHVNAQIPHLSELTDWMPAHIDSLIRLFTAKDPQKRPRNASAALDALDDIIRSIPEDIAIRRVPVFAHQAVPEAVNTTEHLTQPQTIEPITTQTQQLHTLPQPNNLPANDSQGRSRQPRADVVAKKRRRWPIVVIAVLIALATTLGWYFLYGPGLRITIADVEGLSVAQASEKLTEQGFDVSLAYEYSDTIDKDHVIATTPAGGSRIHPDTMVTITVSDGIRYATVPDIVGKTGQEAKELLAKAGLDNVSEVTQYSDTVEKDGVIAQSIAPKKSIPHNNEMTYTVSLGRAPVTIPDLKALTKDDIIATLEEAGLTPVIVEEFSDTVAAGHFISQNPPADADGHRLDEVTVVISKGPELIEVPSVIGLQRDAAVAKLNEAGFEVKVENILGGLFGTVRLQDPLGQSKARPGSTVTISIV